MTSVIELYSNLSSVVKCESCGEKCIEIIEFDGGLSLMQCTKCMKVFVVDSMTRDMKIKCKMCRWLHKRECNSCTEIDARVEQMGIFEKVIWWLK